MTMMQPREGATDLVREGALKLLSKCLELHAGNVLVIFYDETVGETHNLLKEAAEKLDLVVMSRYVSPAEQKEFDRTRGLSVEDKALLESARAIITCVSAHVEGTAFRLELLKAGTQMGKRFGHMPGAVPELFSYAATIDYEHAVSRCDDLALALTVGRRARLQTYIFGPDGGREEFDLEFEIGGLQRPPITSSGIISLGTWGNIPGGETFISPIEDTANGTFVLNGAFKGCVLKPPDYILLRFENGYLRDDLVEGTPQALERFRQLLDFARERGDTYYNSLAELGIGVNTGIQELTGIALFDEKCYGTAHIAIGDNTRYGGRYPSDIHEDLITRAPSLWVDGKPILRDGQDAFDPREWRESLSTYQKGWGDERQLTTVTRTDIHAGFYDSKSLKVMRRVAAGRICIYTVGDEPTSKILAQIFSKLPPTVGQVALLGELTSWAEKELALSPVETMTALAILESHNLIMLS